MRAKTVFTEVSATELSVYLTEIFLQNVICLIFLAPLTYRYRYSYSNNNDPESSDYRIHDLPSVHR